MKYLLLIFMLSGAAFAACPGDGVCLQQAGGNSGIATSVTLTISSTSATTNCLLLFASADNSQTISSVVTTNVTWAKMKSVTQTFGGGTGDAEIWKGTITGATGTSVVITATGAAFSVQGTVAEMVTSGCTVDATAPVSNTGSSTTASTAAYTNTTANDLMWACAVVNGSIGEFTGFPSGYTALVTQEGASYSHNCAYKPVVSAAAQSASWTLLFSATWASLFNGVVISSSPGTPKRLRGSVISN